MGEARKGGRERGWGVSSGKEGGGKVVGGRMR